MVARILYGSKRGVIKPAKWTGHVYPMSSGVALSWKRYRNICNKLNGTYLACSWALWKVSGSVANRLVVGFKTPIEWSNAKNRHPSALIALKYLECPRIFDSWTWQWWAVNMTFQRLYCAWVKQVVKEYSVCLPVARVAIEGPFGKLRTETAVSPNLPLHHPYLFSNKLDQLLWD